MDIQECTGIIGLYLHFQWLVVLVVALFSFWLGSFFYGFLIRVRFDLRHRYQQRVAKIRGGGQ